MANYHEAYVIVIVIFDQGTDSWYLKFTKFKSTALWMKSPNLMPPSFPAIL